MVPSFIIIYHVLLDYYYWCINMKLAFYYNSSSLMLSLFKHYFLLIYNIMHHIFYELLLHLCLYIYMLKDTFVLQYSQYLLLQTLYF